MYRKRVVYSHDIHVNVAKTLNTIGCNDDLATVATE